MDATERELREMLADRRLVSWPNEEQWKAIWLAANAKAYSGTLSAAIHRIAPELLNPDWVELMNVPGDEGKMMWTEICMRSSVSPFVDVNTPFTDGQKAEAAYQEEIESLIAGGWKIVRRDPNGTVVRAPRRLHNLFAKPEVRYIRQPVNAR